uniref:Uncharacterized protein n=1 Tax=Phage sp. ctgh419 TaxID=2828009 RepID=A0A8S5SLD7_9VIRU|nr:MAG TPA: hypothetical protein [Phage sp. ctgh419]DAS98452.1 MAG TPA: hypothetical protein [Caudoviricetes sp.]
MKSDVALVNTRCEGNFDTVKRRIYVWITSRK